MFSLQLVPQDVFLILVTYRDYEQKHLPYTQYNVFVCQCRLLRPFAYLAQILGTPVPAAEFVVENVAARVGRIGLRVEHQDYSFEDNVGMFVS